MEPDAVSRPPLATRPAAQPTQIFTRMRAVSQLASLVAATGNGFEGSSGSLGDRSQAAPGRVFPVTVTDFDPPARLRFSGGMPLGLFRGVRTFEVSPGGTGGGAF